MANPPTVFAAGALYDSLLQAALRQFFQRATFETEPIPSVSADGRLGIETTRDPCVLAIRWFGFRHMLRVPEHQPFSPDEVKLARAVGAVLTARYRAIFDPGLMALHGDLFRGSIEDRYVGAFLEDATYTIEAGENRADRIALAIEVLRVAALSSYENRPISSGVLLLDSETDPMRPGDTVPEEALRYSHVLTAIKSFHRLCDGVHTLFLVNRDGMILDIVDIEQWAARINPGAFLPVPCARAFRSHALATVGNRHVCIVLSPSHEIKVFSGGVQTFTFRNAAWHLLDLRANYSRWARLVGKPGVAERLFQTALDLSDAREGALFVVVRDRSEALAELIAPGDRLDLPDEEHAPGDGVLSRRQLLYLLANRRVVDMDASILAALASMDGATVIDPSGRLLAAGAILLHPVYAVPAHGHVEGARTTAAMAASRFGTVLKVSEDGIVTLLDGDTVWHM